MIHYRVYKISQLVSMLSPAIPGYNLTQYFHEICLISFSRLILDAPDSLSYSDFFEISFRPPRHLVFIHPDNIW
jgi:hypothetical protein